MLQRVGVMCLAMLVVWWAGSMFLPGEAHGMSAQMVKGAAGTCSCCNYTACAVKGAICGPNSFVTTGKAKLLECDCQTSGTNPCNTSLPCYGLLSGSGNQCTTGGC